MSSPVAGTVRQIGMSAPDIGPQEIELVNQVLGSSILSIGPMVEEFERLAAERAGTRHAVAVNSGTAGLHACIAALGIGEGDEVITTPFSFVASANCMLYERAVPRFVDIEPDTGNIDTSLIERAITPRTRAILPVHVFGQPVDMDTIADIARRHGLAVIEDACEAIGAEYRGRRVGALGDAGVFAFYPNKQMTTGEGGVVVTDRSDLSMILRSLRNQGRDVMDAWLHHSRLGFNYRMCELSAALGVAQIRRLDELLSKRERVAAAYSARIAPLERVTVPTVAPATSRMSWFVYVVRLAADVDRDQLMRTLHAEGIPTRPYFSAIHLQPFYRARFGYRDGDFPVTEQAARHSLALPFHGNLSESDIDYVCERLAHHVKQA